MSQKKLGKSFFELGLSELLSDFNKPLTAPTSSSKIDGLSSIPIEQLVPSRIQPRRHFDESSLTELAHSIRNQGILQPIIVRKLTLDQYEIIAGERRWRAAQKTDLKFIPAIIREMSDREAVAIALIENIQRKDLNVLEEAHALQRLLEDFHLTHQEIADTVGKSRSAISNILRLLNLCTPVKTLLLDNHLEMAHARTLLILAEDQQVLAAEYIIQHQLSVREAERYVSTLTKMESKPSAPHKHQIENTQVTTLQKTLQEKLNTKVSIQQRPYEDAGKLTIHYTNWEKLQTLLQKLEW